MNARAPRGVGAESHEGEVVGVFGRHYRVRSASGEVLHAVTRARKHEIACGDRVAWRATSPGEAVIEHVIDRTNVLYRSDQFRQKLIAANVDQVAIVVAVEPTFSDDLLSRALVAAESAGIAAVIVLNKIELDGAEAARRRVAVYAQLGYSVIETSLKHAAEAAYAVLVPTFSGRLTVAIGQSGMGKSTLVNRLVPGAKAATQEFSTRLDAGKHTTTAAQIHAHESIRIVDSPGFQEFGLAHLEPRALEQAFVEFRPHLGRCRFHNCRHLDEPDCAITAASERGEVTPARLGLYRQLYSELRIHRPHYA